jgi:hypothetical protein
MVQAKVRKSTGEANGTRGNEVLAKIVCQNLSCLIHAMEEFEIDPSFRKMLA